MCEEGVVEGPHHADQVIEAIALEPVTLPVAVDGRPRDRSNAHPRVAAGAQLREGLVIHLEAHQELRSVGDHVRERLTTPDCGVDQQLLAGAELQRVFQDCG